MPGPAVTGGPITKVISPEMLVSVEVFEDGMSVTRTDRESQLAGALVGGLTLGGLGAVIGGLTGKSTTAKFVTRVDLRIVVEDVRQPTHDIPLMAMPDKSLSDLYYPEVSQTARWWHGLLGALMHKATNDRSSNMPIAVANAPPAGQFPSTADEIKKLADLYSSGVLTAEEFAQQKAKILNRP